VTVGLYRKTYRDADGAVQRAKTWTLEYVRDGKKHRVSLGVANKDAARIRAASILKGVELRTAGVETYWETAAMAPLEIAKEFGEELLRLGRDEEHVKTTLRRVRFFLSDAGKLDHVSPEFVRRKLATLHAEKGVTGKTANGYRISLGSMFAWLVKLKRWGSNPCRDVERAEEADAKVRRRPLLPEELEALVGAVPSTRSGRSRRAAYLVAATTGLRRRELRLLSVEDLDFEHALVIVRKKKAKNRREDVLPLVAGAVAALRELCAGKAPTAPVFKSLPMVATLRKDLRLAGVLAKNDPGKELDFHALRGTFATSLARSGAPLVLTQRLMRHSDPKLTANVYTRLELSAERAAVSKVDPAPLRPATPQVRALG
jgi:integrase